MTESYLEIVRHYEACLEEHGDTHKGVDWPVAEHVDLRYRTMLDLIRPTTAAISLLDFGCGTGHLLDYIRRYDLQHIEYAGLDLSEKFVAMAAMKYPDRPFYCADILKDPEGIPVFDYIVLNGVLTEKIGLPFEEMTAFMQRLLKVVFQRARSGIAFNVMSKHVDWERDDLFHMPFDTLAAFLTTNLSRHFVFRSDYGLYEYTTYVYRHPESEQ